jgi:hypothetical protein
MNDAGVDDVLVAKVAMADIAPVVSPFCCHCINHILQTCCSNRKMHARLDCGYQWKCQRIYVQLLT